MARSEPPGMAVIISHSPPADGPKGRMKPPGAPEEPQAGGKATDEEAGAVMESDHCKNCQNWHAESGECDKVEGTWAPDDACVKYFTPMNGSEPDADEQGGPPDNDADDQRGAAGGISE